MDIGLFNRYRLGKDLRYALKDLTGLVISPLVRGVGDQIVKHRARHRPEDAQFLLTAEQEKRYIEGSADILTYGMVSAINHPVLMSEKQRLVTTFRHLVGQELSIPADQVVYKDLARSQNPLVQYAFQDTNRSTRWSYISDGVFAVGGLLPFLEDGFRAISRKFKGTDKEVHPYNPKMPSGLGNSLGLGAKSVYFLYEMNRSSESSYTYLQALAKELGNPGEMQEANKPLAHTVSPNLVMEVYNHFTKEYYRHHPEKTDKTKPDAPKPWYKRAWHRLTGHKEVTPQPATDMHIEPKLISNPDIYTQGVFTYVAELLERTYLPKYRKQGSDMRFYLEDFITMVGRGWVDVDHPEITENVARIIGLESNKGFARIDARLAEVKAQAGVAELPPEAMVRELRRLYTETVAEQLRTHPAVAPEVTITIVEAGKKLEEYKVDTQALAEIMGPERLKHYLRLRDEATPYELQLNPDLKPLPPPKAGEVTHAISMTWHDFSTGLAWKGAERIFKERDLLMRGGTEGEEILRRALPGISVKVNPELGYANPTRDQTPQERGGNLLVADERMRASAQNNRTAPDAALPTVVQEINRVDPAHMTAKTL